MLKIYKFQGLESIEKINFIRELALANVVLIIVKTENLKSICLLNEFLNDMELERVKSYKKNDDRKNFIVSHSITKFIFSKLTGISVREVKIYSGENGKPFINNMYGICFNISHTRGCIAITLHKGEIGVDIEFLDRKEDFSGIAKKVFTPNELSNSNGNCEIFLKHWVAKEAYLKYKGVGLHQELNTVEVDLKCGKNIIVDKLDNTVKEIKFIDIFKGYIIAVCY